MSRAHYWQYILNTEGQPVSGAVVSLHTDSPATTANQVMLYTTSSGATTTSSITSDNVGFFEFWVTDSTVDTTYGQNTNTSFVLKISRGTGDTQDITDVHLHFAPPRMYSSLLTSEWIPSAGGYIYTVSHYLNTNYPLVQIWLGDKVVYNIDCITESTSSIYLSASADPGANNVNVIILGTDG
jgi:hypothetical protein